jgi:hypothetical protein
MAGFLSESKGSDSIDASAHISLDSLNKQSEKADIYWDPISKIYNNLLGNILLLSLSIKWRSPNSVDEIRTQFRF